jgi:hypothetical protein
MKPKDRHPGFKRAACCCNCKHAFVYSEYDCGESFYCTLGAEPRPPCGSVELGEVAHLPNGHLDHKQNIIQGRLWTPWEAENHVKPGESCGRFEDKA